jgi:hypothetical protein
MVTLETFPNHYLPLSPSVYCTEYCAVHSAVPTYLRKNTHSIFPEAKCVTIISQLPRKFMLSLHIYQNLFTTSLRHGLYLSIYCIMVNSFWIL